MGAELFTKITHAAIAANQTGFTAFHGLLTTAGTVAAAADLPALLEAASKASTSALGALTKNDFDGYKAAKHRLPMLAAAVFDGPRSARNVENFSVCFVEFDDLTTPLGRIWPEIAAAAHDIPGLLGCWATGRGIRFMFAVPTVEGLGADLTRLLYAQAWKHSAELLTNRFPRLGPPDTSGAKPEQLQAVWNRTDFSPFLNLNAEPFPFDYDLDAARNRPAGDEGFSETAFTSLNFEAYKAAVAPAVGWPAAETHEGWKSFVSAMAHTFGAVAEDLTAVLCRRAEGYDTDVHERETRQYFRRVLQAPAPAGRKAGAGTLIWAARLAGCSPPAPVRTETVADASSTVTLKVKRHVTEAATELAALIDGHEGLTIVKSPTGAGKTRWAAQWLTDVKYTGAEIGVLILPYAAAVRQIAERDGLPWVAEGCTAAEIGDEFDADKRVFITTYDGLTKLRDAGLIVTRAVVDEAHALANNSTFRPATHTILPLLDEALARNGRAVLMTATPPPELLLTLHADVAPVLIADVTTEASAETERVIYDGNGNRAELINMICSQVESGRHVIVHVDLKCDDRTLRGIYNLKCQFLRRGMTVATATAKRADGIAEFQTGNVQVLIGTRIVCESFDVHADGRECVAVSVCVKGVECELITQLGGRFRNAKRVVYICWAWGKGAYLDDYSRRESATEGARPYDLMTTFNATRRRADLNRAATSNRIWEQGGSLNVPALRGIVEQGGRAVLSPLAIAAGAITDRTKRGGMAAALPLMKGWLTDAEYEGSLLSDGGNSLDMPPTEFDTFSKTATNALKHFKAIDFIAVLLAYAEADGQDNAEAARRLASRYGQIVPTCPLAALRVTLLDVAKAEERRARSEEQSADTDKTRRKAERVADNWADFARLLTGDDCNNLLADWAEGWATAADRVWRWLLNLPTQARRADIFRIVENVLAAGLSNTKVAKLHRRYALLFLLNGGVGDDVPAEVLTSLPRAQYVNDARRIFDELPALIEAAAGKTFTASELTALVRERTGCSLDGKQVMTTLHALVDIENVTVTENKKRTTKLRLVRALAWADLGLSFTPREAIETQVLFAADKAEREGVPEARIFRLSKGRKMHAPIHLTQKVESISKRHELAPPWAWLGGPPPELCPF